MPRGRRRGGRLEREQRLIRPVARGMPEGIQEKRNWSQDKEKSSEEEHRADALAPSAEEGRGKLRKATGSRKQAENRRYPNGETRRTEGPSR
jgi:hypothetical protein